MFPDGTTFNMRCFTALTAVLAWSIDGDSATLTLRGKFNNVQKSLRIRKRWTGILRRTKDELALPGSRRGVKRFVAVEVMLMPQDIITG